MSRGFSGLFGPTFLPTLQISVEIEKGKILNICLVGIGEIDEKGARKLYFELNGQPRAVSVIEKSRAANGFALRLADEKDPTHVAAPMPGLVLSLTTKLGDSVKVGDRLLSI